MRDIPAPPMPSYAEGVNLSNLRRALVIQGAAAPESDEALAADLSSKVNALTRFICFADTAHIPGLNDDVLMFTALKTGVLRYEPIEGGGQQLVGCNDFAKVREFAHALVRLGQSGGN